MFFKAKGTFPKTSFKTIMSLAFMALASLCISACHHHEGSEDQLEEYADSFATQYYNWHFEKALKYCTPESEMWLRYAASNVHQADIDSLRAKDEDATIEHGDIHYNDNDTTAIIDITAKNFLQMDSIGQVAHLVDEATFSIPMVLRHGKWMVKMGSLPRSEKQSHD